MFLSLLKNVWSHGQNMGYSGYKHNRETKNENAYFFH